MYNMYKLFDVMELESSYVSAFKDINPSDKIVVLPPVLRRNSGRLILAYLVISQPVENNSHCGVGRPIGAILRNRKNKKILKVVTCDRFEFAPERNDFVREYYSLEDYPDYWPNRSSENEEQYRVALENLFRVVKTIKFGTYKKELYEYYKERIKKLFPADYWYFFDAIEHNKILPIDDEIIYQRELAKKEHSFRSEKRKVQQEAETEKTRQHFISETKDLLSIFIRNDILPTLKRKASYAKIDFYVYVGKMIKNLESDINNFVHCYAVNLTSKARQRNKEIVQETFKVNMIKTYAKACVKPLCNDQDVNNICNVFLKFLHIMMLQEATSKVSEKTKTDIASCMAAYKTLIGKVPNTSIKMELDRYYEDLNTDYFEAAHDHELSDLYVGYNLVNAYLK